MTPGTRWLTACAAAVLFSGFCGAGIVRPKNPSEKPETTRRWPVVTAPLMEKAPVVDGVVDRAEWTPAAQLAPLMHYLDGVLTSDPATVYVGYTRDAVYMAFQFVRPAYALKPISGSDPKGVWKDDCIEFFIRPDFGAAYEYSFVGNAAGVHAQGRRRTVTNKNWKCEWTYKARLTSWGWEGEFAIPFKSLGRQTPEIGETWEFAPMRNRKTPGAQLASWSFLRGWLERRDFGYLIFGGAVPAVRVLEAGPVSSHEAGASLEIANFSDKPATVTVQVDLHEPNKSGVEYFKTVDGAADLWGQATDAKSEIPATKVAQDALKHYTALMETTREVVVPAGESRRVRLVQPVERGGYVLHYRVTGKDDRRIYAGGALPFLKKDPLELTLTTYLLSAGVVEAVADYQKLGNIAENDKVSVAFVDGKGKALSQSTAKVNLGHGRTVLDVPVITLKAGPYNVVCRVGDEKAVKAEAKLEYVLPAVPAWWGNSFGKPEATDTVPEPWPPMERTPEGFRVWNRTVTLGDALQPTQILNGETAMLTSPVRLDLRASDIAWGKVKLIRAKKTGIAYQLSVRAAGLSGKLLLETEFDGFMKYTLELTPSGNARLDRMVLEIPVKPELSTHYRRGGLRTPPSYGQLKDRKALGSMPKEGLALPFTCSLWLGCESMGLEWAAESDRFWSPEKEKQTVEIVKDGASVRARINFVTKGFDLTQPVKYEWAILATPTKPMNRELLRGLRYAQSGFGLKEDLSGLRDGSDAYAAAMARSGVNAFGQWAWRNKTSIWNLDFGSPGYRPSPRNEIRAKAMAEVVRHCHDAGIKWFIVYGIWQVFSNWPDVGTLWREQTRDPVHPSLGGYLYCSERPFADWYIATLRKTIQDTDIDGVYLDSSPAPNPCANFHHGCGYVDERGRTHATYAIWSNREFHKRIYTLFHSELKQGGLVYAHHSPYPFMMVESFVDVHHCGEGSSLTKDAAIPKFYGHPFGLPVQFTRWNNPAYPDKRMHSWRFVLQVDALIKAHPAFVMSRKDRKKGYCRETYLARGYDENSEAVWQVWQAQKDFPWEGTKWIPSWHVKPYADSGSEDMWVCMHLNPGKAALVTISDLRKDPEGDQVCRIKLNWKRMGFDPDRVVVNDVILRKPLPHTAGGLELEVKEKLFRYVEVRAKGN